MSNARAIRTVAKGRPHLRLVGESRRSPAPRESTLTRVRDARRRLELQRDRDDRFAYLRRSYD